MIGEYILFNQRLVKTVNFNKEQSNEIVVYEVIRIIDFRPLFYGDHIERLVHSCNLLGKSFNIEAELFFVQLIELIKSNNFSVGNVMIEVMFSATGYDILAFFIPHNYPNDLAYKNGVEVGFLKSERKNPEAKVLQQSVRAKANKMISDTGFYEVLLLDDQNKLTEGSRSNLFYIQNNKLITAPLTKVLKGVTLSKVLEIAVQLKLSVEYKRFSVDDLAKIDALFLTGTSPKILPVKKAGNFNFDVKHPILLKIIELYDQMIKEY